MVRHENPFLLPHQELSHSGQVKLVLPPTVSVSHSFLSLNVAITYQVATRTLVHCLILFTCVKCVLSFFFIESAENSAHMAHYRSRFSDRRDNALRHGLLDSIWLFCNIFWNFVIVASADVVFAVRGAHQLGHCMGWWMPCEAWAWDYIKFCNEAEHSTEIDVWMPSLGIFQGNLWVQSGISAHYMRRKCNCLLPHCEIFHKSQDVFSYSIDWTQEPSAVTHYAFHHAQFWGKQNGGSPENYSPALHSTREGALFWDWLDPQA